jgi:hypothetical protein
MDVLMGDLMRLLFWVTFRGQPPMFRLPLFGRGCLPEGLVQIVLGCGKFISAATVFEFHSVVFFTQKFIADQVELFVKIPEKVWAISITGSNFPERIHVLGFDRLPFQLFADTIQQDPF